MKIYIFLPLIFTACLCFGQAQFVIQNDTKTEVYNNLNSAVTNAQAGDTIYLPGGGYTLTETTINKPLHWVGCGHYPSGTTATGQTRITSDLIFNGDCDYSSFEGIWFQGTLQFGDLQNDAKNIKIKRCRLGTTTLRTMSSDTIDINFQLTECVQTGELTGNNASNCQFKNNLIIRGYVYGGWASNIHQSSFRHNIFSYRNKSGADYRLIINFSSCTFENNIFTYQYQPKGSDGLTFNNNIFRGEAPTGTSSGENNITNKTGVFISVDDIYTFSYDFDYHITEASGGKNAATDGTNIGIYGSNSPYKENAVPYYPHINGATIATDAIDGQLGTNISVQAQDR